MNKMIIIKSKDEIDIMRESGRVTGWILKELENIIKPGTTTLDIDEFVESTIKKYNMIPTFKGYYGYPANCCVSVNEEVVHGIPSKHRVLKEGDIAGWSGTKGASCLHCGDRWLRLPSPRPGVSSSGVFFMDAPLAGKGFTVITLGCRTNHYKSETIASTLFMRCNSLVRSPTG